MTRSSLFGVAVLAACTLHMVPASAGGWQEIHQAADDVRVRVGTDGIATVQHHVRLRIVAGRFKAFDFARVDAHAELVADSSVVGEKGGAIAAHVEANPTAPGSVRITFDEPRGLGKGVYAVDVTYRLDLVAAKMLVRDGAMWRLAWTAPPSPEGHDGARVVFELPAAPTEPRLASPESAATTLATLRRDPEKDELELVRAHIPRGEAVTWSARVDPKAFPRVVSPELRPPVDASIAPAEPQSRAPAVLLACGLAAVAGALATALRAKQNAVAGACRLASAEARTVVPLPWGLGPFAYGAATAGGLAELLWGAPVHGAALVVVAMALGAHRVPRSILRPRGPGRWRPIVDEEVLVVRPPAAAHGDSFDVGTRPGRSMALLLAMLVGVVAFVLRARVPGAAVAIPLAATALVPLFVTGTRAQLPATPADLAVRLLAPVRDNLGRLVDLAHIEVGCLARVGEGTRSFDEVRLACAPTDRIPGLRAIELALTPALPGAPALPEVLVRFDDGSQAAAKIAELAPGMRVVPGRSAEEKVLRLAPRVPTPLGAARLLARLAADLEGHRSTDRTPATATSRPWKGTDRRVARGSLALRTAEAAS